MGGARIELLLADSEIKPDVARSEVDRLIISPSNAIFLAIAVPMWIIYKIRHV
jgi:hypothetical protein